MRVIRKITNEVDPKRQARTVERKALKIRNRVGDYMTDNVLRFCW